MAFKVNSNGNIELVQGDSGKLTVSGIPTDKSYDVYLAIQDTKRKPIGTEIHVTSNTNESVVFNFLPQLTDLLTVKRNEESAEYYYGVKVCDVSDSSDLFEDTLLIGDSNFGDVNTITVYPKKVEGSTIIVSTTSTEEIPVVNTEDNPEDDTEET